MTRVLAMLCVVSLAAITGCKRQKAHPIDIPTLSGLTEHFFETDTVADSINAPVVFDYLTTRSKISFKNNRQKVDQANVSLRVKKDSLIWMSATLMGFEVFRGILSTDGVRFIDRVNKVYIETSYGALAGKLGFPIDYRLLQSFLLADLPAYPGLNYEISSNDETTLVKQADDYLAVYNEISRLSRKTVTMTAIDLRGGNRAHATYSTIAMADQAPIPYDMVINLLAKDQQGNEQPLTISLTHSSVTITDSTLSFPFHVPINYKKAF